MRNFLILTIILSALTYTQAIEMNNDRRSRKLQAIINQHPQVQQEIEEEETTVPSNETELLPGEEIEIVYPGNMTNMLGYEFKNYTPIEMERLKWNAFMLGGRARYYSPNASECFNMSMNLYQYDVELLMVKYMYGDSKQNVLNTTLFMGNVSDMMYICIDATENLYVYSMYKFDLFGRDKTNVILGYLQNLLGNILTINKLYGEIIEYDELNKTEEKWYELGRIARIVLDFEPIVLEDASLSSDDDDEITYSTKADTGVWGSPPLVMQEEGDESQTTNDTNSTNSTTNTTEEYYDTYDNYYDINDLSLEDFDWSFGLFDTFPGLKYLSKIGGPFEFTMGFLNGTQFLKDPEVLKCENLIQNEYIENAQDIVNMTGVILETDDRFENVYNIFDQLLLITKITQQLHPIAFHCYNGGENVYKHFFQIIAEENGYSPKTYIMNSVYNFGHIFDNMRDAILFFTEDPRGQVDNVHNAGYHAGLAVYYFITPDIAYYDSPALEYELEEDEVLEENAPFQ